MPSAFLALLMALPAAAQTARVASVAPAAGLGAAAVGGVSGAVLPMAAALPSAAAPLPSSAALPPAAAPLAASALAAPGPGASAAAQASAGAPAAAPAVAAAPIPAGAAYAAVLSERGWAVHRAADAAYLLVRRAGVDARGRRVLVIDAVDLARPGRGPVAHVDFALRPKERQAVFDGPMDRWAQEAPELPGELGAVSLTRPAGLAGGLSVLPAYRHRGLAGLLMDVAAASARADGAEQLIVLAARPAEATAPAPARAGAPVRARPRHHLLVKLGATPSVSPRDKTLRFLAVMDLVRRGAAGPLPEAARGARVLLVPGLFGNRHADTYGANLRRLAALGLRGEVLRIDTEGRTAAAHAALAAAVRGAPGPVVLVGHSRGGVIAHDWYRLAPPELKAKVSHLLLIQAPLGGTRYADWVLGTWWRRLLTRAFGWLLRADLPGTARELTRAARAAALAALPPLAPADLAKTAVLRTVKRPGRDLYGRRAGLMAGLGEPETDGIVPADAALVPGAADIVLRDVDHSTTVLKRAGWLKRWRGYRPHAAYDAGDLTEALVRLLLR